MRFSANGALNLRLVGHLNNYASGQVQAHLFVDVRNA